MIFEESLTERIIGVAIEVHKFLDSGLLESAFERWNSENSVIISPSLRGELKL